MGNLHSVSKALATTGAQVTVSSSKNVLRESDLFVLPGVGSFGAAMVNLAKKGMDDFIVRWISEDRPFLGICLGLQLLFQGSEESPGVPGLGVIKGRVVRFREKDFKKKDYVVPHMGWNTLRPRNEYAKYFKGIKSNDYYYFVHTYFPAPQEQGVVLTETLYGKPFCSAVARGNLVATQFHPEKSGAVGLRLLKNIVRSRGGKS
ncbi:MAG: Imidazole glycerol phosphate synthase subunit HisH [Elusimicrobia bacterium]|nr:Imidazole glycerol phosphate synthase subunit HisH [Elusimicrobiota bacterium]